jgi:hypothetical protein
MAPEDLVLRFVEVARRTERELVRVRGRLRNLKKSRRGWKNRDRLDWLTREEARLTRLVAVHDVMLLREGQQPSLKGLVPPYQSEKP